MKKIRENLLNYFRVLFDRIYLKFYCPKIYNDIYSCPQWVWEKVSKEEDLSYLICDESKRHYSKYLIEKLVDSYGSINDSYISKFGFPTTYIDKLKLEAVIETLRFKAALTGKRQYNTLAAIKQGELDQLEEEKQESVEWTKNLTEIEKYIGSSIDEMKITIFKYENYLRTITNG